jgi:DNA-binding Lrp family transcriptional regulator
MASSETMVGTHELDLLLLELMVQHPLMSYKELAGLVDLDQRTVAKRIKALTSQGVLKHTIEIDWSKLGLQAKAYVGSSTAKGIDYARKLHELINNDPRIVEGYETLGTFQYFLKVIDSDVSKMRGSVLTDLDPLTAELTVSLVTKKLKEDYGSLLRYLRETNFPRSRGRSDHISEGVSKGPQP